MAFGYRNEAISILGREVMQPRGLTGLGIDTLDNSGDEILHVFDVLADSQQYPIIVHCTQ
jgi:protein-tyrosine phosphatase